ncbi:hypothetical protein JTE90_026040 [Oedothorax gibbosus]|uniref:Uncharacterized protein n=1 Tax=Oedothorax gibbosus TaxID=931172 RepID=A0AAV6UEC7_9ARAC|nr:hypothetical protein JTE90_026040 [Oedothorax gibbosus]
MRLFGIWKSASDQSWLRTTDGYSCGAKLALKKHALRSLLLIPLINPPNRLFLVTMYDGLTLQNPSGQIERLMLLRLEKLPLGQ